MQTTKKRPLGIWHQFLIILGLAIVPTILTVLGLPFYRWMDDAAIIPIGVALVYGAPGICLAAFALGLVGSLVNLGTRARSVNPIEASALRARWRPTMAAAAIALGVVLSMLGVLLGLIVSVSGT